VQLTIKKILPMRPFAALNRVWVSAKGKERQREILVDRCWRRSAVTLVLLRSERPKKRIVDRTLSDSIFIA
jgi:hypothetical protein